MAEILYRSLIFLEGSYEDSGAWCECYLKSLIVDSSLINKILNITMRSPHGKIKLTVIESVVLSKNAEMIAETYETACNDFETGCDNMVIVKFIENNPKLAIEVFEKFKNKKATKKNNQLTEKANLDLLSVCVRACPQELSKKGFEIATTKFGITHKLDLEALEFLVACIKANPQYGQYALDLVRLRVDTAIIFEVLCAWESVDPANACPAIYKYFEKATGKLIKFSKNRFFEVLIRNCVHHNLCIPNFFERTVELLVQFKLESELFMDILRALLPLIPVSPLDKKKFDLLFNVSFFSCPQLANLTNHVTIFCDANLVLAQETIKNIKRLGGEIPLTTCFLKLLNNTASNFAEFIIKEIKQLVEGRKITDAGLIQSLLIGCILADRELVPEITNSGVFLGLPIIEKNKILKVCISSNKRKLEEEVGKRKK